MTFVATKKGRTKNIFPLTLLVLLLDPGSEIRDKNQIRIPVRDNHPGSATLDKAISLKLHPQHPYAKT
jgi:hypothetical protein